MTKEREQLATFGKRFEELEGIILDAHLYGTNPHSEESYLRLRNWFLVHYKDVKGLLRPGLTEGSERGILEWPGQELDSFERLIGTPSLDALALLSDDTLTKRFDRVRDALRQVNGSPALA